MMSEIEHFNTPETDPVEESANFNDEDWWDVIQVWKVPRSPIGAEGWCEIGIYPSGELMALHQDERDAQKTIESLREFDSDRFDDEPYKFVLSYREFDDE